MDTLQKLIVLSFGLTIITAILGLSFFYIEKPYISKVNCSEKINSSIFTDKLPDAIQTCSYTEMKSASPLMEGIINSSVVFGIIFISLSIIAFYRKRKLDQQDKPQTP